MFSRSDLDELVAMDAWPAVSIYLPTHVAGREIRQDPIRLKNLLPSAAERLASTWRRPEIEDFLGPAESLVEDEDFWRHQQQGLGVFLAPRFNRIHKVPIPVPEETFVGDYFHIKPLLPLFEDAGSFWGRSAPSTPAFFRVPGGNLPKTRRSICRKGSARSER